jgi:hypothetical protein
MHTEHSKDNILPPDELPQYESHNQPKELSPSQASIMEEEFLSMRRQAHILSSYSHLPHAEDAGVQATLDLTDPRNRVLVHAAVAGESASLWDLCAYGPAEIDVQHLIAHYAEYESEETPGEIRKGPMLTMIGPGGIYHTGSVFAFRALQLAAQLGDVPPWDPPMRFQARRASSRNRRQYQTLICLGRSVV